MAAKRKIDWDAVEPHYRANIKTLTQIAKEFGCSIGRITQVATERGWERDLTAKIRAKAQAKLNKTILKNQAKRKNAYSETEVIEANSDKIVAVELSHRRDVTRAREFTMSLFDELKKMSVNREKLRKMGERMLNSDSKDAEKLLETFVKVSSVPSCVDLVKKLADSIKIFVGLERDIYGITAEKSLGETLESLLEKIDG